MCLCLSILVLNTHEHLEEQSCVVSIDLSRTGAHYAECTSTGSLEKQCSLHAYMSAKAVESCTMLHAKVCRVCCYPGEFLPSSSEKFLPKSRQRTIHMLYYEIAESQSKLQPTTVSKVEHRKQDLGG